MKRALNENDVFVRFNEAISILNKVKDKNEITLDTQVSSRKPFGLATNFQDYYKSEFQGTYKLYGNKFIGYVLPKYITKNSEWIDKYKVYISKAGDGSGAYPIIVSGKPFLGEKNSVCTETYIVAGVYEEIEKAQNLEKYLKTKFIRFLISLKKVTQDMTSKTYSFVPKLDMNITWTDKKLYKKYELTKEEIEFIESMIKEMN